MAARNGALLGLLKEQKDRAEWGGIYSTYTVEHDECASADNPRAAIAQLAAKAETIPLHFATAAVFLARDGFEKPWEEVERRKPIDKQEEYIEKAKHLLESLRAINVPEALPEIG